MKITFLWVFALSLIMGTAAMVLAADGDPAPPAQNVFNVPDPLASVVNLLGVANLSPSFTLSADQKVKIQAIRDDFKKTQDKWKSDHSAEITKIQSDMMKLRQNMDNGDDPREAMQGIMQERQTLMATAPSADDSIKAIRAVLTDDQQIALDKAQAASPRQQNGGGFGFGGPDGFGPGGPGGPGGPPPDGGGPGGPGGAPDGGTKTQKPDRGGI